MTVFQIVATVCVNITIAAFLGRVFMPIRPNLFCEPCRLNGRRMQAEKIYHMACVKPPVGDIPMCLTCAGTLRTWDGELVDIADA